VHLCATQEKVNGVCRKHAIPFYSADSFGYRAFFFADLAGHSFVVCVASSPSPFARERLG
jgi:hypothetical protein